MKIKKKGMKQKKINTWKGEISGEKEGREIKEKKEREGEKK